MQVKCRHCGGENAVHPGQQMLFCSFCGSALVIERTESPEHLILPHKRNDRGAEEALRSYLLSRRRGRPEVLETRFAFTPLHLVENEKGDTDLAPASTSTGVYVSYPPAGNYRYFDENLAEGETVIPIGESESATGEEAMSGEPADKDTAEEAPDDEGEKRSRRSADGSVVKILHLPIYTLQYKSGKFKGTATIVGGSWQVQVADLPSEGPSDLKLSNLIVLAALFTLFLFIGKLAGSWLLRFVYVLLAATAGFTVFYIREKVGSHS